jgi:hypothetical protein
MTPAIPNEGYSKYNLTKDKNYPYYIWSFAFNVTFLDIIDKCHNRNDDLKILCLPELQPVLVDGNYQRYFNDWSKTKVDIIYAGYDGYDKEKMFYQTQDLFRHLNPNRHFFTMFFLYYTFAMYQHRYQTPTILTYNPKYHFTSYNRLARPHRLYILQLMKDYGLLDGQLPSSVVQYLQGGVKGSYPETPKSNDPIFKQINNHLIATAHACLEVAAKYCESKGVQLIEYSLASDTDIIRFIGKWIG